MFDITVFEDPMLAYLTVINMLITIVRVVAVPAALIYSLLLWFRIARSAGKPQ